MFKIQEEELVNYIKEISSGNEIALREFYNEYGKLIYTMILSIVKSKETAEEVLQDVLMAIVTHQNDKSIVNAKAWLFKVIQNVSYKKLKVDQLSQSEALSEYEEILFVDNISEEIENSADQIEALKCLDRVEQQCILLCVFGQMKLPQVADVLGMPYNKVCNKYDYAVRKLRKHYKEGGCQT